MKVILRTLVGLLPASSTKNAFLRRLGYDVHKTAHIGPNLLMRVDFFVAAQYASVGPFNVFRDLTLVHLGEHATIGQWNWISAARPLLRGAPTGTFVIGEHSAVTSRHYVDCSGGVSVGRFSTVAGVRSTFITHGIDWRASKQTVREVTIGDYCLVSSNVSLAPGVNLPSNSVVGMGATLAGTGEAGQLWLQDRARSVKGVSGSYFLRTRGFVDPGETSAVST
jgi:acetyltransferase-like isoleucine patch superfamily enzyme